ncbi:hypothetical protein BDW22DRAFT_1355091 [Trametopsis cervina]|nr:hypothetical protein BDW22DRAFT_1355091 [Trametopsis cervina]
MVAIRTYARARWITCMEALQRRANSIRWNARRSSTVKKIADMIDDWARGYADRLNNPKRPHSEAAATTHEAGDLDIMADADKLQGNDEIVGTAMVDALQQITTPPEEIIKFVLKILQHRIPWEGKFEDLPQLIDLNKATSRALDSIHSILQQHLLINDIFTPSLTYNRLQPVASGIVTSWIVYLYFSLVVHDKFTTVRPLLWERLNSIPEKFVEVAISELRGLGLIFLLRVTRQWCWESKLDLVQSLTQIKSVIDPSFQKLGLTDSFESDNHDAPWRKVLNGRSLRDTVVFLIDLLRDDTAAQDGEWSDAQHDALSLILKLIATQPWEFRDSIAAVWRITLSSKSDAVVVKLLMLFIKSYPVSFDYYVDHKDFRTDTAALSRVAAAIETIAANTPDQLTRLSILKACNSLAWSLYDSRNDVKSTALTESWRGIFAALTSLVQAAPVPKGDTGEEAGYVGICLNWLSGVNAVNEDYDPNDDEKYLAWRAAFKPEESSIPDGFYLTLMDISIPTWSQSWRVRRLQEMTSEERDAAGKDIEPHLRPLVLDIPNNAEAGPSMLYDDPSEAFAAADIDIDTGTDTDIDIDIDTDIHPAGASTGDEEDQLLDVEVQIIPGRLQLLSDVVLVPQLDHRMLLADSGHGDGQDEMTLEDADRRDLEAAVLSSMSPPGEGPSDATVVEDNQFVTLGIRDDEQGARSTGDGEERVGPHLVDEGIADHTSPKRVLPEPKDNSDVLKIKDEQGLGISGDGGE